MTLPDKAAILDWIRDNPRNASKREIARAFGLKGADRVELKRVLREMISAGEIDRSAKRHLPAGHLPPVAVLVATTVDADGDLSARPQGAGDDAPPIRVIQQTGTPALAPGDRFLARLNPVHEADGLHYEARPMRTLARGPRRSLGILRRSDGGGVVVAVDKSGEDMRVEAADMAEARDGDLVAVEAIGTPRMGLRRVRVVEVLGDPSAARAVSLIAIHQHGLPLEFPDAALAEAQAAQPASAEGREDLRGLPLLTIDPADARDHDDAVQAEPDRDPANPGGWIIRVAIADVAHYVRPGSALDREARRRGNSAYFPDRVVPMLPDALSGDLCSLHDGVDRPCVVARITIAADGRKLGHVFSRAVMRSAASLTYEQAQAVADGAPHALAEPVMHLFGAYRSLAAAREARAPLHLDLPERRIELDAEGRVTSVRFRERLEAHRVVEDMMILANVCAAETLEARQRALLYRVHEEPGREKIEALREQVETIGLRLAKGQVLRTRHLNALLDAAAEGEFAAFVNMSVLRAQTQAYYSAQNFGHFGLALRAYAHFTSPIRRYADLIVHRALIAAHGWGRDGQTAEEAAALVETAEHISRTERRAMEAERDTTDRYLAAYLADRTGAEFSGRVSGVARFGLFVKLDETGADGIIPISTLGREYWRFDPAALTLTGEQTRRTIGLGQPVLVRLAEAEPVTGGLRLELLEIAGDAMSVSRRPAGKPVRRKAGAARIAAAKTRRKAARRG